MNLAVWNQASSEPIDGECFYLNVKDDSMAGEGIRKGMQVLVQRQSYCENGKIGLVVIGNIEGELKRVYYEGDTMVLKDSEGISHPYSPDEIFIVGQVKKAVFDV
ncbi:LexA family protein [Paenibacillus sp. EC2-1]|uniref:LexA family protein n=1 Tax=Paenibacillus sp. EC2-1 TaxID=3388665 RepID=UPI003BEF17EF